MEKKPSYLPPGVHEKFKAALEALGEGSEQSKELISKLLDTCREQISRGLMIEANALYSQLKLLLLDFDDSQLIEKARIVEAVLEFRAENVHGAKDLLREIIAANTEAFSAMFEYIDICETAPEAGDDAERYEAMVRAYHADHPRLHMLDAVRAYRQKKIAQEYISTPSPSIEDPILRLRYTIQKAIVFDVAENVLERDGLLQKALSDFPNSPKINQYLAIFRMVDALRANPSQRGLEESLIFSKEQRTLAEGKDPLLDRDRLVWDFHEFLVRHELFRMYAVEQDLDKAARSLIDIVSSCFQDRNILSILKDLLLLLQTPEDDLKKLLIALDNSSVPKSRALRQLICLQAIPFPGCHLEVVEIMRKEGDADLVDLLSAVQSSDAQRVADIANAIAEDSFSLGLMNFLQDKAFSIEVASKLRLDESTQQDFAFLKIEALVETGKAAEALQIVRTIGTEQLTPLALGRIARIAFEHKEWNLFIDVATRLCKFDIPKEYRNKLLAKLAFSSQKIGDDAKAIQYGEEALADKTEVVDQNIGLLMWIVANGYYLLGQPERAVEVFGKYNAQPTFEIKLTEAQFLLRTQLADKIEKATQRVLEAFALSETYDDRTFVTAFSILNEVNCPPNIIGLASATPGAFVKLEDLGWIYLGDASEAWGATAIGSGPSYDAVVGTSVSGAVVWPPDKYAAPGKTRALIHVLTPLGYLAARAHEGLDNLARLGTEQIWTVHALKEDGTLDLENITAFLKDQFKNSNEFFDKFVENVLPFGFLAAVERDIAKAISKISSEGKGFIRCNNGTSEDIERQDTAARGALTGSPCVMDGLVALMLAEAGLLPAVVQALPHLCVPVSVISYLRKFASDLDPTSTSKGRGGLVAGTLRFTPRSVDGERELHSRLLEGAALLDALPSKTIGRLVKDDDEDSFAKSVPSALSDPFYIAVDRGAYLLTDDGVMPQAYELAKGQKPPAHFSSLALIRALQQTGVIPLADYLRFFSLLAGYRYHLLPISVDDLLNTVMPKSAGGLISVEPRNIEFLQIQLTLSKDYGVNETVALKILSLFFGKLVQDDTVPEDVADTIFAYSIVRYFGQRDSRLQVGVIQEVCKRQLGDERWLSSLAKRKFAILVKQLKRFSETYDPFFAAMPVLLKTLR